jgi:ferritin
MKLFN